MGVTVEEVKQEFVTYHHTNFGYEARDLPSLDLLVVHGAQHTEVILGHRSVGLAVLVRKLLSRIAESRSLTLILIVRTPDDMSDCGFVRTLRGWVSLC